MLRSAALFVGAAIFILLGAFSLTSIHAQSGTVKNIVLVHGAWADGSGWRGVYEILVKDGYKVSMVQEPETTFQEDVAAAKRSIALQDGPCILVAHSYGGAVITEAGNMRHWSWQRNERAASSTSRVSTECEQDWEDTIMLQQKPLLFT
jgi:pimeloyl-ACP methyl ester carboxylesterase